MKNTQKKHAIFQNQIAPSLQIPNSQSPVVVLCASVSSVVNPPVAFVFICGQFTSSRPRRLRAFAPSWLTLAPITSHNLQKRHHSSQKIAPSQDSHSQIPNSQLPS